MMRSVNVVGRLPGERLVLCLEFLDTYGSVGLVVDRVVPLKQIATAWWRGFQIKIGVCAVYCGMGSPRRRGRRSRGWMSRIVVDRAVIFLRGVLMVVRNRILRFSQRKEFRIHVQGETIEIHGAGHVTRARSGCVVGIYVYCNRARMSLVLGTVFGDR